MKRLRTIFASLERGRLVIGSSRWDGRHPRTPSVLIAPVSPGRGFSFARLGTCPCLLRLCNLGTGLSSTSVIGEEYAQ